MANKEGYERLANAIVIQAAEDYRKALKKLNKHPRDDNAKLLVNELERFFKSQWYNELTDISGEWLMEKIKKSVQPIRMT